MGDGNIYFAFDGSANNLYSCLSAGGGRGGLGTGRRTQVSLRNLSMALRAVGSAAADFP